MERPREILPIRSRPIYPGIDRKTGRALKSTPIHRDLPAHDALMGRIDGRERPLWYAPHGVLAKDEPDLRRPDRWEHVGNEARMPTAGCAPSGMSRHGTFRITASDARAFLDCIASANVPVEPGKAALSLFLSEIGGISGDIMMENSGAFGRHGLAQPDACDRSGQ